jgi:hypothetical protein
MLNYGSCPLECSDAGCKTQKPDDARSKNVGGNKWIGHPVAPLTSEREDSRWGHCVLARSCGGKEGDEENDSKLLKPRY